MKFCMKIIFKSLKILQNFKKIIRRNFIVRDIFKNKLKIFLNLKFLFFGNLKIFHDCKIYIFDHDSNYPSTIIQGSILRNDSMANRWNLKSHS